MLLVLAISQLPGCGRPVCRNEPLSVHDPAGGYRFETLTTGDGNTDDVFIALCFSGGGTRAGALAYGVLEGLRDTPISGVRENGQARRLLDEVDVISSVSGGSFTAMAYGLEHDGIFNGEFERKFLKQNIQSRLVNILLRPVNLLLLPYALLDRIDLAARYYNQEVFDDATYADLLARGDRPYLVLNATNMSLGARFEFTQDDFDILGSDLASLPVGHAVAASAAFPLLLSPLRLKYYDVPEDASIIEGIVTDPLAERRDTRRFRWAESLLAPQEPGIPSSYRLDKDNHKYLYLLDGGLTDNLGADYVVQALRSGVIRRKAEAGKISRLVVVIVDANTDAPEPIEHLDRAPGLFLMALKTGTLGISSRSEMMTKVLHGLMRENPRRTRELHDRYEQALAESCPEADPPEQPSTLNVEPYLIEVDLHDIEDEKVRKRFLAMPTSFFLTSNRVDALVEMGSKLLTEHPEFVRLVEDLSGN